MINSADRWDCLLRFCFCHRHETVATCKGLGRGSVNLTNWSKMKVKLVMDVLSRSAAEAMLYAYEHSQALLAEWKATGRAAGQPKPEHLVNTQPYATAVYLLEASVIVRALDPTMGPRWRYRTSEDPRIQDCIDIAQNWVDTRARYLAVSSSAY